MICAGEWLVAPSSCSCGHGGGEPIAQARNRTGRNRPARWAHGRTGRCRLWRRWKPGRADATTAAAVNHASQPAIDGRFAVGPGGHELVMRCLGEGSPTIILVSAVGDAISDFAGLLAPLAKRTLTCAYDRLGTGQSDPVTERRRTIDDVIADLRGLIGAAKVPGPYLLVGQSLGGNIAHYYAGRYPARVAGVVLLDVGPQPGISRKSFRGLSVGGTQNTSTGWTWIVAERGVSCRLAPFRSWSSPPPRATRP